MANTVTKTSIVDGENVGEMHVFLASDGSSGELNGTVLLDSSALAGGTPIKQILGIKGTIIGFNLTLAYDQNSDFYAVVCAEGEVDLDFRDSPVKNPSGVGTTGDVLMFTTGFTAVSDIATLIIKYRK